MSFKVFIDGREGTTGLQIEARIKARPDIQLLTAQPELRKDPVHRAELINAADAVFLCLPDAAARESAALCSNPHTVLIDASTAHRTAPGWTYGLPELSPAHREAVRGSKRIANPGCHATGFITAVYPLVAGGLLSRDARLCCYSLTGYSGGGKKMIAQYEAPDRDGLLDAPRQYALGQTHKHLKEMQAICGLDAAPIFCPIVADFYSGMVVTVPLFREDLQGNATADHIRQLYGDHYRGPVVRYLPQMDEAGFLSGAGLSGRDSMELTVAGNDQRILLLARYDNLGKGASGAAIQCLNLSLGCDITEGLVL